MDQQTQISFIRCLPIKIKKRGAKYILVERGEKSMIYKKIVLGTPDTFEVFKIKTAKEVNYRGIQMPAREIFPHDEAFGNWAWTAFTLERAYHIFQNLENKKSTR